MQLRFLCFLLLGGFLTACDGDEFLAEAKVGFNQAETEYSSNEALDDLVRGAYFNLKSPGDYGPMDMGMYQDIATDIVDLKTFSSNNSGNRNLLPLYNREASVNDIRWLEYVWAGSYTLLYNTNLVINYYEDNGPIMDGTEGQVPRIQGEAYFLRALTFHLLSTVFAPPYSSDPAAPSVILRTEPTQGPTNFQGRATNEEVYRQIISDVKRAIELLPEAYDASIHNDDYQDRAKRDAARSLLAKVYFHMGPEYHTSGFDGDGGALEQINAVLESGDYPVEMAEDLQNFVFGPRGLGQKAPETIWYASYYFRNAWRAPRYERHYSQFVAGAQGRDRGIAYAKPTLERLMWTDSLAAPNDQRFGAYARYYAAGEDPTYPDEYEDSYNVWSNKFLNRTSNFVVMRSPLLYLYRAAIRVNQGDGAGAAADLNVTRSRAGLEPLSTATLDEVDEEFVREMAFEGHYLSFRQGLLLDILPGERSGGPIPYDDPSLVRDLPETEYARNPMLAN